MSKTRLATSAAVPGLEPSQRIGNGYRDEA